MGFLEFLKRQWKNHQINEERKRVEREHLRRISRDARVIGYAQGFGLERGRQRAREKYYREKRQREASRPDKVLDWMFEDPFKKQKKRRR